MKNKNITISLIKTSFTICLIFSLMQSCNTDNKRNQKYSSIQTENIDISKATLYSTINPGSNIKWRASHLAGIKKRFGSILIKDVNIYILKQDILKADIHIDMTSLQVENFENKDYNQKLMLHLKNDDFFKVEKYPTSKFELLKIEKISGEYNSNIIGKLSILDKTKIINFKANIKITDSEVILKSEDFNIDRLQWGLSYNKEGSVGVAAEYLISNKIGFSIDVKLSK